MAKKEKKPRGWLLGKKQVDDWQALATQQMMREDYDNAMKICQRILQYIPKKDNVAAEVLGIIGAVFSMRKEFDRSYKVLTQALDISPLNPMLHYNRGLSCMYTSRIGQALVDFRKAVELGCNGVSAAKFWEQAEFTSQLVDNELALRGAGFTLEQLLEQQEFFQQGLALSSQEKWTEAEACLRRSIDMGDCLPQPQGNLGVCLLMQKRFEEARSAFCRALEIDPHYELAAKNLDLLEHAQRHPDKAQIYGGTNKLFQEVKTGIIFVKESAHNDPNGGG